MLLKNDGDLLPLAKTIKSLAVIGPNADSVRNLVGDYAYPCHVESLSEMTAARGNVFDMPTPDSIELADYLRADQVDLAGAARAAAAGQSRFTMPRAAACSSVPKPTLAPRLQLRGQPMSPSSSWATAPG